MVERKKVAVVGERRHAAKLRTLIEADDEIELAAVYHPNRRPDHPMGTSDLERVKGCDGIVIASPNNTHVSYLRTLKDSTAKIMVEKPLTVSEEELSAVSSDGLICNRSVYVNYNYRHSDLACFLEENAKAVGRIVDISIVMGQGLAFKEGAANDWRFNAQSDPHVLVRTKAVHWIDLAMQFLGEPTEHFYRPERFSEVDAYDTAFTDLRWDNGAHMGIFTSYAMPLKSAIRVIGTNGIIDYDGHSICLKSPRDCFDENGYFVEPPIKREIHYNNSSLYSVSLERSVNYFLDIVKERKQIEPQHTESVIQTETFVRRLLGE